MPELCWRVKPAPVDKRPVSAVKVFECRLAGSQDDLRMAPRDRRMIDANLRGGVAADDIIAVLEEELVLPSEDRVARHCGSSRSGARRPARHRHDEAVAFPHDGLNKSRHVRIVFEYVPDLSDGGVDRSIMFDEHA